MKTLLFTLLLVLTSMTGQAQEARTENKAIADTYWRNEATGEWMIGFAEKHAIFDNKVWDIVSQTEKKDAYTLMLNNGTIIEWAK